MKYPVNCKKCNQPLYGPVKYCPFCRGVSISDQVNLTVSLTINANPAGAAVFLNGERKGTSPLAINDLKEGKYTVRVEMEGYKPKEEQIPLGQESKTLDITLEKTEPKPLPVLASLTINTNPSGATVFLNGERKGNSPLTINDLEQGSYTVRIELEGNKAKEEHISLGQESKILDITLEKTEPKPLPIVASLTINTNPSGASVFLNGERKGNSPLTINNLSKGNYTVRLECVEYKSKEEHVTLGPEGQKLDIKLEREKTRPKYWIAAVAGIILIMGGFLYYNNGNSKKMEQIQKDLTQKEEKIKEETRKAEDAARKAETNRQQAEIEKQKAEIEKQKAEIDRQKAEETQSEKAREDAARALAMKEAERKALSQYMKDGKRYFDMGKYELSIEKMKEVLRRNRNNSEAERYVQMAQDKLKQIEIEFRNPNVGGSR